MKTKQKAKKLRTEIKRLAAYSVVGGAWFWSGYLTFAVCDQVFGLSLFWAKLVANLVGLTVNFILERIWVFDHSRRNKRLTIVTERYFIITVINLFVDYLIVLSLRDYLGISPYIGQFVAAGFFYGWNYLWYKYWVFAAERRAKKGKK